MRTDTEMKSFSLSVHSVILTPIVRRRIR